MSLNLLEPVVALVLWSLVMWVWMYATRIPAMQAAKIDPQSAKHPGTGADQLPSSVRQVADNYNHLMEQPTIFYALILAMAMAGLGDNLNYALGWGYVASRVVHSLVQATINLVMARFLIFVVSTLLLAALAVRAALVILL